LWTEREKRASGKTQKHGPDGGLPAYLIDGISSLCTIIMPRIFENGFDIPLPWSQTALAVWHKYPNPYAPHVISMDVLSQTFDEQSGLLRVERILGVRQPAPGWAVKV
jgi:hypothetical protein